MPIKEVHDANVSCVNKFDTLGHVLTQIHRRKVIRKAYFHLYASQAPPPSEEWNAPKKVWLRATDLLIGPSLYFGHPLPPFFMKNEEFS